LILHYKAHLLNDLKICFDEVTDLPKYFNVKGRTWIPIDCNDTDSAALEFQRFESTWTDFMERITAVAFHISIPRHWKPQEWYPGYQRFLLKVGIYFIDPFGFCAPTKFEHRMDRLKDFVDGYSSLLLPLDEGLG
jgi:hypothetical protein